MSTIGENWFEFIELDPKDSEKSIYRLSKEKKHTTRQGNGKVSTLLKKKNKRSS